eukprot:s151_g12.t1
MLKPYWHEVKNRQDIALAMCQVTRMFRMFLCLVALCTGETLEAMEISGSPAIRGGFPGNVSSSRGRVLGGCEPGLISCGGCQCVEPSTCRWCHGMGGTSPITAAQPSSCGIGLVNCGICRCTTRSSCATCDGQGGPAAVISSISSAGAPLIQLIFLGFPLFT